MAVFKNGSLLKLQSEYLVSSERDYEPDVNRDTKMKSFKKLIIFLKCWNVEGNIYLITVRVSFKRFESCVNCKVLACKKIFIDTRA